MICIADKPLLAAALYLGRSYVAVLKLCGPVMRKIQNVIKWLGYEFSLFGCDVVSAGSRNRTVFFAYFCKF